MSLIGLILILFIAGIVNMQVGTGAVKKFLSATPAITSGHEHEHFKAMVRQQMYQSLLQILILGSMGITGIYGIISGKLSFLEFVFFLLLNGAIFFFGRYTKKIEGQARNFKIADETLAGAYASVCESWIKKPFPDF